MRSRHPSTPLRVGVIGTGVAGGWFIDILRRSDGAHCPVALRSRGGDVAEAEQRLGVQVLDDAEAFFASGLDAVIVASPSGLHAEHAQGALERGLHVLVEKPVAIRSADADALVALATSRDLRLGVVLQRRADPLFRHLARVIGDGALGRVVGVQLTLPYQRDDAYYASAAWRGSWALDGGGVLMNQGIHLLDVLVWWFGDPLEVQAQAATLARDVEVEDTAAAVLRFGPGSADGALGSVLATTAAAPGRPHRLEVLGTRGSFTLEGERVVRWDVTSSAPPAGSDDASARDPRATDTTNHARLVADFVAAVRARRAPLVDGAEGVRSLRLVERIYAAAGVPGASIAPRRHP